MKTAMKDSGIKTIGQIPIEWEILPMRGIFFEKNNKTLDGNGDLLSVSNYTGITKRVDSRADEDFLTNASTLEGYKIVEKNDLVINIMLAWNGSLGVSEYEGITSPAYDIFGSYEDIYPKYYHYLLRTKSYQKQFKRYSTGVIDSRLRLYSDKFLRIYTIKPPISQQQKIADFLDQKTEKINTFIKNKKELIKLLEEQKTSIINKAVTKGIDENVKMKDSGILWIGEIPKSWEVRRLKTLSNIKRGASPRPIDDQKYFDDNGEFSWVRISDVTASDKYLNGTEQQLSELGASLSVKQYPGDLFLSIAGSVGKPIITNIKCCIHDGFVTFGKINPQLNKYFLYYILGSGLAYSGIGKEGTQLNLNIDTVGNISIPFPDFDEQKKIVSYIESETKKIDDAIEKIENEISLIQEYKDSLIYHAVTGKIDI